MRGFPVRTPFGNVLQPLRRNHHQARHDRGEATLRQPCCKRPRVEMLIQLLGYPLRRLSQPSKNTRQLVQGILPQTPVDLLLPTSACRAEDKHSPAMLKSSGSGISGHNSVAARANFAAVSRASGDHTLPYIRCSLACMLRCIRFAAGSSGRGPTSRTSSVRRSNRGSSAWR